MHKEVELQVIIKNPKDSVEKTLKACLNFLKNLNIQYELQRDMGYPKMLYRKLKKEKC